MDNIKESLNLLSSQPEKIREEILKSIKALEQEQVYNLSADVAKQYQDLGIGNGEETWLSLEEAFGRLLADTMEEATDQYIKTLHIYRTCKQAFGEEPIPPELKKLAQKLETGEGEVDKYHLLEYLRTIAEKYGKVEKKI